MKKISFREKINYRIDEMMSRGSIAMISLLALISLVIIILAGILISILGLHSPGDEPMSILEAIWQSLMRALDSGTIGGDLGWSFRLVTFLGNSSDQLEWEVEGNIKTFLPNTTYYVDTRKMHRLSSWNHGSTMVVWNVQKTWTNVLKVLTRLKHK